MLCYCLFDQVSLFVSLVTTMYVVCFVFYLQNTLVNRTTEHLALKNILDFKPVYQKRGLLHRCFPQLMQVIEFKRFDYPQIAQNVLKDARVKHAIETSAVQQFQDLGDDNNNDDDFYQQLLKRNEERARKLLRDMRSTLSDFLLKYVLNKVKWGDNKNETVSVFDCRARKW